MEDPSDRVDELADRVRQEREAFEPPGDAEEADECAKRICREGVGPTIMVYVDGRAGNELVAFSGETFARLERTLDDWLALYARCYGVDADPDVTVRAAAEVLVDTHNAKYTAEILTGVPERT